MSHNYPLNKYIELPDEFLINIFFNDDHYLIGHGKEVGISVGLLLRYVFTTILPTATKEDKDKYLDDVIRYIRES